MNNAELQEELWKQFNQLSVPVTETMVRSVTKAFLSQEATQLLSQFENWLDTNWPALEKMLNERSPRSG